MRTGSGVETKISDAELAERLADVLDRVRSGAERFVVERDGEPVAVLSPPEPVFTWGDFVALMTRLEWPDEDFAGDLQAIHDAQGQAVIPEWPE